MNFLKIAKQAIGVGLIINGTRSVIDNIFKPTVYPKFGSVVYCDLVFGAIEHSGIYVGNGKIVHLNRFGQIEAVDFDTFIKRTSAISIYVSCKNGQSIGSDLVGKRALAQIGQTREYNVLSQNCHQFASSCLTGQQENSDLLLSLLKQTARKQLGVNQWLVLEQLQA